MKVFVEITRFAARASWAELRERVTQLEDAGDTGVTVADHLFHTHDDPVAQSCGRCGLRSLTTLALIGDMSARLEVQTIVALGLGPSRAAAPVHSARRRAGR
jgi:hypothetical protein